VSNRHLKEEIKAIRKQKEADNLSQIRTGNLNPHVQKLKHPHPGKRSVKVTMKRGG
jgi:hypothetical protein